MNIGLERLRHNKVVFSMRKIYGTYRQQQALGDKTASLSTKERQIGVSEFAHVVAV